jgi:hypothetical protein
MRRKTVRTLADLGRAAALAASLAAGATWLWWSPATVAPVEAWLQRRLVERVAGEVAEVAAGVRADGAAAHRERLEQLHAALAGVRVLDRLAPEARAVRAALAEAAARRGDEAAQRSLLQEAVAFDANDLAAAARLHALRSRDPAQQADALEQLRTLAAASAHSPEVVRPRVDALLGLGRAEDALAVLDEACAIPLANDWRVSCLWDGRWRPPVPVANTGGAAGLRLSFQAPAGTQGVRVHLPAHASCLLVDPRLQGSDEAGVGGAEVPGQPAAETPGVEPTARGLRATGQAEASFVVAATLPSGAWCTVTAGLERRPPRALAQAVLAPAFEAWAATLPADAPLRATWRAWRAHAVVDLGLTLVEGADRRAATITCADGGFVAHWRYEGRGAALAFELPPAGACPPWRTLAVHTARGVEELALATLSGLELHDVQRTGAGLVATGPRPRLALSLAPTAAITGLSLLGDL